MAHSARRSQVLETRHKGNPGAGQASFDRMANESAKAYQAFTIYRDLPIAERSLVMVSQRLGKNRSLCARWSTHFKWVERATAWDSKQDQIRRTRLAAEREKMLDRHRQNSHLASQALMVPLIALIKQNQAKADLFAGCSATELVKVASSAARELPRIHAEERALAATPDEISNQETPFTITGAEFTWVQSRCTCGHPWDSHDHSPLELGGPAHPICKADGCPCKHFYDEEESPEA